MAKITMEMIKELREKTQVGMMDCKKALIESEGDIEKAVELLRKKGAAVAQKRSGNATDNGHIESCISNDNKKGVLLKVSCETDFSANTTNMKSFAKDACKHILNNDTKDIENLLSQVFEDDSLTFEQKLQDLIAKIAENIKAEEFIKFETDATGFINSYIHAGSNLGVLIELKADKEIEDTNKEKLTELTHNIAMQIAVTIPLAISPDTLDKSVIEKEQEVLKDQLLNAGKPAAMIDKIMVGKLNKFYEDVCLENQKYIKDDKKTIKQLISETSKETGLNIKISNFARFSIGK